MNLIKNKKGFTLIELLLVIAIIGILAAIVIIAVNPNKQLLDARNAQRKTDIKTILDAAYQYSLDNSGAMPNGAQGGSCVAIPTAPTAALEIMKTSGTCAATLTNLVDITNNEKYLTSIPVDPTGGVNAQGTGYFIQKTANGRITVSTQKESTTFSVTR
jgi:prepilin-type N-terminal cleavage/methylation domain-containing protein